MELEFESSAVVWLFGAPGRHRARGTERGGELPLPSTLLLTMALLLLLLLLWPAAVLFCDGSDGSRHLSTRRRRLSPPHLLRE